MNKYLNAERSTYICIRTRTDQNGEPMQMFAGMFASDSDKVNVEELLASFKADPEITIIRVDHDGDLPSVYWAEIESQPAQTWFPMIGRSDPVTVKPEDVVPPPPVEDKPVEYKIDLGSPPTTFPNPRHLSNFASKPKRPPPGQRGRSVIRCKGCGQTLESKHVHDFVQCSCPNHTFIDGGTEYQRMGGADMNLIEVIERPK